MRSRSMWWMVGTVLTVCARCSLTVDNAPCYPSADSPQTHPRGRRGHPVLQVQAVLQRSAWAIRLHWWVHDDGLTFSTQSKHCELTSSSFSSCNSISLYLSTFSVSIMLSRYSLSTPSPQPLSCLFSFFSAPCSPGSNVERRKIVWKWASLAHRISLCLFLSLSFLLSIFPVGNLILSLLEWWRGQLPAPVNLKPLQHVLSPFLWA